MVHAVHLLSHLLWHEQKKVNHYRTHYSNHHLCAFSKQLYIYISLLEQCQFIYQG